VPENPGPTRIVVIRQRNDVTVTTPLRRDRGTPKAERGFWSGIDGLLSALHGSE
jgi:hypothetical protein